MKYLNELPKNDQLAINTFFEALGKQGITHYQLYESPLLYIIYIEECAYFELEEQIECISQELLECNNDFSKPVLCAPMSFKASYEKRIETDECMYLDIDVPSSSIWQGDKFYTFSQWSIAEGSVFETEYNIESNVPYCRATLPISSKDSYGYAA